MKTIKFKKTDLLKTIFIAVTLTGIIGCTGMSTPTLKMNINPETNTFSFIDTKSKLKLFYTTLIVDGKKVVDTHCMDGMFKSVVFAFDNNTITRSGGSLSINGGKAYTEHAELKYKLENNVLTILGLKE